MLKKYKIVILIIAIALIALFVIIRTLNDVKEKYEKEIGVLREKVITVSSTKAVLEQVLIKSIRKNRGYSASLQNEVKRGEALERELENLNTENVHLKGKINQIEQEKFFLSGQLSSLKKIQCNLQFKIRRLLTRSKVELGQLVITTSNLSGKVLKANRPYNFIIIDLGKNDGIQEGMDLVAYRDDKLIGELIVEKVYDELSVGKAAFRWLEDEIDVGDIIKARE